MVSEPHYDDSLLPTEPIAFPAAFVTSLPGVSKELPLLKPAANLQTLADQLLLQHFSPDAVLVNNKEDILYISGRTGKYLEPAAGKANWNLFAMAREGLRIDLGNAFQKALRQKGAIIAKGLKVGTNGGTQAVDITIQTIEIPQEFPFPTHPHLPFSLIQSSYYICSTLRSSLAPLLLSTYNFQAWMNTSFLLGGIGDDK